MNNFSSTITQHYKQNHQPSELAIPIFIYNHAYIWPQGWLAQLISGFVCKWFLMTYKSSNFCKKLFQTNLQTLLTLSYYIIHDKKIIPNCSNFR